MTSTSGAKISMFGGAKTGFVIPKNKLSGSLIPIFQRGTTNKTLEGADKDSGLHLKLGKRKTKWGPDLSQDIGVKKARVLAYQKRLDQITQRLASGTLEVETNRESALASQNTNDISIAEQLDFEKREAIGEILELNPRYKAPRDYKPLLKEARLPIDVKEHSDFSFLSIIFGSQGDTQKRLEKETGAKVQIFGTKTGGEKVELSPSHENEIQTPWQTLYFQISSDTYEKVDAAIAVIELLMSSVSGNTAAGAAPSSSRSEDISTTPALTSEQPTDSSLQPPESQLQQHGSSFPWASNQAPFHPPLIPSASGHGYSIQEQELPSNSMNLNPLSAQQSYPVPHDTSLPPGSHMPRPPDSFAFNLSNTPRAYSVNAPPYAGSQIQPIGPHSTMRPSTLFTFQPVHRPTLLPDIVSSNMAQSVRPLAPNFSPHPVAHQQGTEPPSIPFPTSINLKHLAEYGSGGSMRPMSVSAHITGRPAGLAPTYPPLDRPINTAPRPFSGDFGFLPQQRNVVSTPHISPRPNSQSAHLPHLSFQAPSVTLNPRHLEQNFTRLQHFDRQMEQPLSHPSTPFHGNARSSNLQNFGPPSSHQMMPRNFPGAQFPQHSTHFPPRPVFHHDNLVPRGQPQIRHRFNSGVHQVYDPFSPGDV
ncbi:PREDICTED: splicing factor 1-like [Camelina sativa]|uniref:Splicing factor 1-like n=1 Tax=Camelina sativa TaxID=90675 RepID=A0ABM0YLA7_CAMSA|nr:PREDICTED: splicing factor 1-like [Camelina sativa]